MWRPELRPPDQGQQTNREVEREAIRAENFWCSHSNTQLALVSPPPPRVAAVAAIDDPSPIGVRNGLPGEMACSGGEYEASRSPLAADAAPDPMTLHPVAGRPRVVPVKPLSPHTPTHCRTGDSAR